MSTGGKTGDGPWDIPKPVRECKAVRLFIGDIHMFMGKVWCMLGDAKGHAWDTVWVLLGGRWVCCIQIYY